MPVGELTVIDGMKAGTWIGRRLGGEFGAVTLQLPAGYEAYVRICHPAHDRHGRPVVWSQVAAATARTAHALMQWHAIVGSPDPHNFKGSSWPGRPPHRGNLAPDQLEALCRVLAEHTSEAAPCFFGIWIGWGYPELQASHDADRPSLTLPGREYLVFEGTLDGITQPRKPACFDRQSPNLMWPESRAWFVASEIDFDSTLVGGTSELIQAILGTPELDAWPVKPDDSLAYDADKINQLPSER